MSAPGEAGAATSRLPILFIMMTVMIDSMGIGLILPVLPDLILELNGGTLAAAAIWGGILSTSFAVMQFLCGPLLGTLSDRYGRRPVLLVSVGVMALDYLVMALAGTIWLLLGARVVAGVTAATQSTATAFLADISAPHEKAVRFGLVGASFGLGFVLGPLLGGLLGEMGTRAPFYAAAALAALNLALGWLVLPETVTDATRRAFRWRAANPLGAVRHLGRLDGVRVLLAVYFLYQLAFYVYPATWAYFTQARFGWDPGLIGVSLAVFGISMAGVQGVLIRPAQRRLGEPRMVQLGLSLCIAAFVTLAALTDGRVALALIPAAALGAVVAPSLQSLMSRATPGDEQGALQGVLTSVNAVAVILAPLVMTGTFAAFTHPAAPVYLPGAAFLLSAALVALALGLFLRCGPASG
ncbi:MFS transporter [Rhodosalinus sp. 5P4]|uniref:MFS transporter n=1 Tax=Rhodosalinus sp. 5P4 TaxID=3239196 RepID=UPI0035253472